MAMTQFREPTSYNIVLVGKTGSGKSATGNTILGRNIFKTYYLAYTSGTVNCELQSAIVGDVILNVIDTPGLMDTGKTKKEIEEKLLEVMSLCPDGFHAFIFVIRTLDIRFTKEEEETLNQIKSFFGPTFKKCCIIAFTHGDGFDLAHDAIPFTKWLKLQRGQMATLIRDCDNRCLLFYNDTKYPLYQNKRKETVSKLVQLIQEQTMVYTDGHFKMAVDIRRNFLIKEELPQLDAKYQQQLSLIIADLEKGENLEIVAKRVKALQSTIGENKQLKILVNKLFDALLLVQQENIGKLFKKMYEYFTLLKNPPHILRIAIPMLGMAAGTVGGAIGTVVTAFIPPLAAFVAVGAACVVLVNAVEFGKNMEKRANYTKDLRLCEVKLNKLVFKILGEQPKI